MADSGTQEQSRDSKQSIEICHLASLIGFLGGGTSFFPLMDSPLPPYGAPLTYFIPFHRLRDCALSIARYRYCRETEPDLYPLLCSCWFRVTFVMLSQVLAFGQVHFGFSLITLGFWSLSGFFSPNCAFARGALRVLFKKRYDYWETLLRSSKDMISDGQSRDPRQ
jgi:hypothetical protein